MDGGRLQYTPSGIMGFLNTSYYNGGTGGSGEVIVQTLNVQPGAEFAFTIGKGGRASTSNVSAKENSSQNIIAGSGGNGGNTTFGNITAKGGTGAKGAGFYANESKKVRDGANGISYGNGGQGGTGATRITGASAGSDGWIEIEYTATIYEEIITDEYKKTETITATDKAAPAILELYLNGIQGDATYYQLGMSSADYGTTYLHYITGTLGDNKPIVSNAVETEVITGIQGFSWIIDKYELAEPDDIIGWDDDENVTKQFPKKLETDKWIDQRYYMHVKPIDGAGNIGETIHLRLQTDTITLNSHYEEEADSNGYGKEYVHLTWENTNTKDKYHYRLFQKQEGETEWGQVSVKYDQIVNVLNVYPHAGDQLKGWMENPNSEEPEGYGKGLIKVTKKTISEFNRNPNGILKNAQGEYIYDVIMFGSWDCNNDYDLSAASAQATDDFIKTGRGVLFGHDTICGLVYNPNFNKFAKYLDAEIKYSEYYRVGSSTVRVYKKGFLTKEPYDIEIRDLTVPYTHTSAVLINNPDNIWIRFQNIGGKLTNGPVTPSGSNNYYLAAKNNCAFIRTGHMNGQATPDEQKILANVLFYLGQVTDDTEAYAYTAEDKAAPEVLDVGITDNKNTQKLKLDIKGVDHGTGYDHYVVGMKLLTAGTYYSNTVHSTVKTGIKQFQYVITNSADDYTGTKWTDVNNVKNKEETSIQINRSNIGKFVHIRAIDGAGNVGKQICIELTEKQTISKEEKDATKELYCIEENVEIPAEYDGTTRDATVEIAGRKELVTWPLYNLKLFEIYDEREDVTDWIRNPYAQNGMNGYSTESNSLGNYKIDSVVTSADDAKAYILSHYNDNNIADSESQNALYELLAEEGKEGSLGSISRRNALYIQAKAYANFRNKIKNGYRPTQVEIDDQIVGYDKINKQYIMGPFKVDYIRDYISIKGEETVNFSGIGTIENGNVKNTKEAIHVYDQKGNEINQNNWGIVYNNQSGSTREENYPLPQPNEEFYITIKNTNNVNFRGISKIEIEFYTLKASAQYRELSGKYDTIKWNARTDMNKCEGGSLCPHGSQDAHYIGFSYYIIAERSKLDNDSQRLLEVISATRKYEADKIELEVPINPDKDEDDDNNNTGSGETGGDDDKWEQWAMDFSGSIWNDQTENSSDGLKDIKEAGIKGVEVFLYDQATNKLEGYTVTDEYGRYAFNNIMLDDKSYYIQYTYDGQTYKTTQSFVYGSAEDYLKNGLSTEYANVSIVDENADARKTLNNRFETIVGRKTLSNQYSLIAIGKDGQERTLEYKEQGNTSYIQTRDQNEKAYQEFQIAVNTKDKNIYFPLENTINIGGINWQIPTDNNNINVGLSQREQTDESLKLDVYQTIFSIKGQRQTFLQNEKNIRNINSNKVVSEYIQQINPADYKWRLEDYKGKVSEAEYNKIKEIYGSAENSELETYVEYMIIIRNNGLNDTAYIEELADYYDKNLEYKTQYRDYEGKTSWIVIRNEDETESTYAGEESEKEIIWKPISNYGDTNPYSSDFNKIYADLGEYGIKRGQYAEIHIIFRVLKDNNGNILLDSTEGKKNAAEINAYRTVNTETGETAGLIDMDSKPGDLNPRQSVGGCEDDEDKAPNYKLQLGYTNGNTGGSSGSGDGDDNGGNGQVETDINGNPIGYGNTIEGNVWEDIKTDVILEDNRKISNGIKEEEVEVEVEINGQKVKQLLKEELIDHVRVELLEVIGDGNEQVEVVLDTVRTGTELLLTDKGKSTGAYRFSGLTSGKYKVRFIYGEKEQLLENIKYNGQDYQALSSAHIVDKDKTADLLSNNYKDTEIMLVIDNSNSMSTSGKMNQAKQTAQKLITDLQNKLPGVKIGVVNFNETAKTIGKVGTKANALSNGINSLVSGGETAIARGIIEAKQGYKTGTNKLMIIITDGQETVDTEELVISQVESLKSLGIKLATILTGNSDNIFGTVDKPRYGKVISIANMATNGIETGPIYQEIVNQSEIEADRSLGKDIEGAETNPEAGTRRWQINEYKEMTYEKGVILNIEEIEWLEGQERINAIEKLANTTWMQSETKEVEFSANNVGKDHIHEVNQALVKRPTAELKLREEISSIKVMLSDGTVIIDTAKGLNKNVMGLDVPNATISVYMDEEIMQGATIEVAYKLVVENVGEVDRLSNYFEGASDETITTTAKVIYAYINENVVYRPDNQTEGVEWTRVEIPVAQNDEVSPETQDVIEKGTKIALRTDVFKEVELYPVSSKEVRTGQGSSQKPISEISTDLILSKLISPESDEDSSLTYDCAMEITVRGNEVGRRVLGSVPGNIGGRIEEIDKAKEQGTHIQLETEEATSRRIIITKPLGEDRSGKNRLIALAGFTVLALASCLLKRKNEQNNE